MPKSKEQPPEVFYKKVVLKNFAKLTGKHLCLSLFFNKDVGLRPATLIKKDTPAQMFSCEYYEVFKNTFFTEHLWTTASKFFGNQRRFSFLYSRSMVGSYKIFLKSKKEALTIQNSFKFLLYLQAKINILTPKLCL